MDKSPDAFRTISEVADVLETPAHVLRFWESRFTQIKPVKRAGGRRYYRPTDVALLAGIKRLLHDEGLTIRGVQKILRDQGARHVAALSDDAVLLDQLLVQAGNLDDINLDTVVEADAASILERAEIDAQDLADDPGALADLVAALGPTQTRLAHQPAKDLALELPLFAAAAVAPAPVMASTNPQPKTAPAKPALRDDSSFASVIRALPADALVRVAQEIAPLARRLSALRALCAGRADGGLI